MNVILSHIDLILYTWVGLAVVVFIALFFISAPYGRYAGTGWGPMIPVRWAWIAMEAVSPILFLVAFVWSKHRDPVAVVLMCLWVGHYVYRAFIFPFLLRPGSHLMPLSVVLMSVLFNSINAGANGIYLFVAGSGYSASWVQDPRFFIGVGLFTTGFIIHLVSDRSLRHLRGRDETGYKIPKGGLFNYISCPNYFGEIIEWTGWAIATWNLAGLSFAVWTIANLMPRARAHHKWYVRTFPDYPSKRRAVLPFIF